MKVNDSTQWIKIPFNASSFLDLINGGNKTNVTKARRATWQSLIPGSKLQENCDEEGFNIEKQSLHDDTQLNVRFGIVSNNQNDCKTCDSCIGFGITARGCNGTRIKDTIRERNTTCGNLAICNKFNNIDIPAFGYILVK